MLISFCIGDIKPDNLIFHHKVLKYIDFGLSFVLSEGDANSKDLGVGTPIYAAPEQLKGEYPAFAADVFSLGMVLFELMSRFKTDMERAIAMMNFRNRVLLYQNPNPQCGFLVILCAFSHFSRSLFFFTDEIGVPDDRKHSSKSSFSSSFN
jgi:serine/threonine protein kinase